VTFEVGPDTLVGILLMVEGERLVLVFQRTTREAGRTRRLDAPTRTRGRNVRGDLLAMRRRDSRRFAIDGAKVLVDHRGRIVEGHSGIGVVGWCW